MIRGAGLPAIGDATTAEPSVVIEELPAEEPVFPTVIRSILRRPKTEIDAVTLVVSQSSKDTETSPASQVREPVKPERWRNWVSEESLAHDTPQVEEPAEYNESRKASGHSPMSEAWKELEANLLASRGLTKLAREKEAAVMKEWDNFHDYAGATEYSGKWYNLVEGHKEELAATAKFRQQRAERAREARESRELPELSPEEPIKNETLEGTSTSEVLYPGRGRRTSEGYLLWAAVTRRTQAIPTTATMLLLRASKRPQSCHLS